MQDGQKYKAKLSEEPNVHITAAAAVAAAVLLLVLLIWPLLPEQPVHLASHSVAKQMNVSLDNKITQEVTDAMCNMSVHVTLPRTCHGMLIAQP